MNFKCLYFFSSPTVDVMEVKRLGKPADAPPSEVYQWIILDKQKNETIKLSFKAMEENKRTFDEAQLQFNEVKAILFWNNRMIDLSVKNPADAVLDQLKPI